MNTLLEGGNKKSYSVHEVEIYFFSWQRGGHRGVGSSCSQCVPNVFPSSSQCVQITLQCFHKLFPSSSRCVPQCVPNAIHMEFHKLCPKLYSQNLFRWAEGTHLLYFYFGSGNFHLGYCHKFHLIWFYLLWRANQTKDWTLGCTSQLINRTNNWELI